MSRVMVFDIGRVLIHWDPEGLYDRVIGPERRRAFMDAVPIMEANDRIDAGAPFRETLDALAAEHPDWRSEIEIFRDRWGEMAAPDIPKTATILRDLKANGVPVWALTNFGAETFVRAQALYPVLTEFERAFVSAHLGLIKPDPAIYAAVERAGVAPGDLYFTDDKPENVAAAAARGWHTHLFEGPDGLRAWLQAEDMLPAA